MDRPAALALLSRIEAYYSPDRPFRGPVSDAWLDMLEHCDEGAAGTTLARLKSSTVHATPAAFEQLYRTVQTIDGGNKPPDCPRCDGCGWVQSEPNIVQLDKQTTMANPACEPCSCSEGQRRATSAIWRGRGAA